MALNFNVPERELDLRGTITLSTGSVVELSPTNVMHYSITERSASTGFALGEAQSATYNLEIDASEHDLTPLLLDGAKVTVEAGINIDGDMLYVPFGVWYISSAQLSDQSAVAVLSGGDALEFDFDGRFTDYGVAYPRTLLAMLQDACKQAGVELATTDFINSSILVEKKPKWPEDVSIRGVVGYIAACAGGFARINRSGELEIISYDPKDSSGTVTADTYKTLWTGDGVRFAFNCVAVKYPGEEHWARFAIGPGIDGPNKTLLVDGNPLYTETIARNVMTALNGFVSDGVGIDWIGDPTLRLGDIVTVEAVDGTLYTVVVNNQSISYDGGLSASTESSIAKRNGSSSGYSANEPAINADGLLNGGKLVAGSVVAEKIAAEAVTAEKIAAGAVTTDKLDAGSVTAEKIKAGALDAETVTAVTGAFNKITVSDELYAAFANVVKLAAGSIESGNISTDQLAAVMADIVTLTAKTGEFDLATIKNLLAEVFNLEQGYAGTISITNLIVTSANLLNATVGKLVLKGPDGTYYRVFVGTDGKIQTEQVQPTDEEIEAGQTGGGQNIVETTVNAELIHGQTITGQQGNFNSILTQALNAGSITAQDAFIASATVPLFYTTAIKAVGDTLDLSANKTIQFVVGKLGEKSEIYRQDAMPDGAEVGDLWVEPSTGYTYQLSSDDIPENVLPEFSVNDAGELIYEFAEGQVPFEISINEDGDLVYSGTTLSLAINEDGEIYVKGQWGRVLDNDLYDELGNIKSNTITREEFRRFMQFDVDTGLTIGASNSTSELLLNEAGVSVKVGGKPYSKFAANYVQFGNYQIRKSANGALVFKLAPAEGSEGISALSLR